MLRITDDLQLIYNKVAVPEFPLAPNKRLEGSLTNITNIVLGISRDAFSLSLCLERIEHPDNMHARHIIIDRNGQVYQAARLDQPINHLPANQRNKINNNNSVAVELVNAGKLFHSESGDAVILRSRGMQGSQRLKISNTNIRPTRRNGVLQFYEVIYHNQYVSLCNLVGLLRQKFPNVQVIDCERWLQLHRFALPPDFPRRQLNQIGTADTI